MKISIITVCLNSIQTIEQTIQSVIRQNYKDYEYIVIDGGSTDGTLDILGKYKKDISIVISEPDEGIYDAMNKGIAIATGDIVGIINSDDWYEKDVFEMVEKCFRESEAEVIYGRVNVYRESREIEISILNNIENIRYEMTIPHPAVFIKRDIYIKYGVFQQRYKISADYELMLRLYSKGIKFVGTDKVLANFRRGGISEQQGKKAAKETLEIAQSYLPYAPLTERRNLKNILLHRKKALYFEKILDDFSDVLVDVLITKSGIEFKDNIVIFGAGKWGVKTYDFLLKKGIHPLFIVDNDKKKWGQNERGKKVISPESLKDFKGVLLILVKEFCAEILRQVESFGNPEIFCITWDEIAVSCMLDEKL